MLELASLAARHFLRRAARIFGTGSGSGRFPPRGSMDNVNYSPKMIMAIQKAGIFDGHPFSLVDVGCSQGIDSIWRNFGKGLQAVGFDPNRAECERLQSIEKNPNVRYFPMAVGLPDAHEYRQARASLEAAQTRYESSLFTRTSAWHYAIRHSPVPAAVAGPDPQAAAQPERIALSEFFQQQRLNDVDFIKVDTDGSDLEVLLSVESCIASHGVLGFMVECNYQGSHDDVSNTFHNIDRFLKRHGFGVYAMTVNRYSRAVLPAPFVYNLAAQTRSGQAIWGDIVFLRDLVAPQQAPVAEQMPPDKILKLACLFEIFNVPDCAVELILQFAPKIATLTDPEPLLDLLTPPLGTKQLSYRQYLRAVESKPNALFPGN